MSEDRLAPAIEADSLIRRAESEGGFGLILHKGDPDRGALLLLLLSRGTHVTILERALGRTGNYGWQKVGPAAGSPPMDIAEWTKKRLRFDEDCWLIELDIADPERFIAETTPIS